MASTEPVRALSGLTTAQVITSAAGVKVFSKLVATQGAELANANWEPGLDIGHREIKNMDTLITVYVGETVAKAASDKGYPLKPGEVLVLGHGAGRVYLGDVYVVSASGTPTVATLQF